MDQDIEIYNKKWGLTASELLTETNTSRIFKVLRGGQACVLKHLKPLGVKDEGASAGILEFWAGHGAVALLEHDQGALLLEYVDGQELVSLVRSGEDEQATQIIAQVIQQLHDKPQESPPKGIRKLESWFESLFKKAAQDEESGQRSVFCQAADLARKLLADPDKQCVLHGDIHHENIIHCTQRGWLVIDPKGLWGDRYYEVANSFYNPMGMPELTQNQERIEKQADIFCRELNMDKERLLQFVFVYGCLSACWFLESGDDASNTLKTVEIVRSCLSAGPDRFSI